MSVRWVAGVALLLVSTAGEAGRTQVEKRMWVDAKQRKVRTQQSEISKVAQRSRGAVVAITTRTEPSVEAAAATGDAEPQKGLGSGFLIHPDGYILTSSHVIEGADEITISLLTPSGVPEEYTAEVVGLDAQTDCALLKIDAGRKLPILKLGSAKEVQIADWVVVIGNPFGLAHSVTVGVVSYKGRTDVVPSGRSGYFDYLQTDASINPGNSGGPVLDLNGDVIAIANAVNVSGQGIAFAIPIDMAKQVLPDLWTLGRVRRGWMGVSVQDLTPDIAGTVGMRSYAGVFVSEVMEDSPASRAGLRVGDVITGVDRSSVRKSHTLRWKVATSDAGEVVALQVRRRGRPLSVKVKLEDMPSVEEAPEEEILARGPQADERPDRAVSGRIPTKP